MNHEYDKCGKKICWRFQCSEFFLFATTQQLSVSIQELNFLCVKLVFFKLLIITSRDNYSPIIYSQNRYPPKEYFKIIYIQPDYYI